MSEGLCPSCLEDGWISPVIFEEYECAYCGFDYPPRVFTISLADRGLV